MASINPNPLVLNCLRDLSDPLRRTQAKGGRDFSGVVASTSSDARGGIDKATAVQGQAAPAPVRYGAITVTARSPVDATPPVSGVHVAVQHSFNRPGIRFGNRSNSMERPTSDQGTQSCHFSQTSVSNTSPILEMIKAVRGGRRITRSRATAHTLYMERVGAAERLKAKRGLGSEWAIIEQMQEEAQDRSSIEQQAFIEREGTAERAGLRNLTDDALDALDYASFGTIGETIEERKRFWQAVEASESKPQGDTVRIKAGESQAWWDKALGQIDTAPKPFQAELREAFAAGEDAVMKLETETAFAVHQWAVAIDLDAPIEIEPGRGGRTQTRIIAELPHELDPRERLEIVRDFANKLTEKGLPYWAVIHAPDANNDERNYHVHLVYYDRPAVRMKHPKTGEQCWDFEVLEERVYKNYTRRVVRPFEQNKPREANALDWIPELRTHWETVSNAALEKAGVAKRYHLGSNASVGIAIDPMQHIKPKTFNKERTGELTADGVVLARRQWKVMLDRILMGHAKRIAKRRDKIARMETKLAAKARSTEDQSRINDRAEKARKSARDFGIAEVYLDITKWCVDRVVSRPKLVLYADENKTRGQKPLRNRKELLDYVDLIYQRGLLLNRENELRVLLAARRYRRDIDRLAALGDPGKRYDRSVQVEASVFDQDPAWKETEMRRISERMEAMAQDILPKIVADIKRDEARAPAPRPDGLTAAPLTTEPSEQAGRDGVASPTARVPERADASGTPDNHSPPVTVASSTKSEHAIAVKAEARPARQETPVPSTQRGPAPQRTLFKSDQQIAAERAERERARAQAAAAQPAASKPGTAKLEQAVVKATREPGRTPPPVSLSVGPAAVQTPAAMPTHDPHAPAPRVPDGISSMRQERQPEEGRQAPTSQMAGADPHQLAVPRQAEAERQRHRDAPAGERKRGIPSGPNRSPVAKPQPPASTPMPETRRLEVQRPQSTVVAAPIPERPAPHPDSLGREAVGAPVHPTPDPAVPVVQKTGFERVIRQFGLSGQEPREDKLKPAPQPDVATVAPAPDARRRSKKRNKKHSDGQEIER
ncbi:MobA/MobL family protein [Microvirga mediterraneensis]|uniref:MobA/MobL family protein n=1 Tax=Microvirga mediterraneensis TaxID=2754695 RepID=A0A838BVA4_9HYPH|nr:MobA/MobL family protein [Microvirga mediterraneensis]MBA1159022.1 MobA/MobL family protein [Microvirga mediterraneensis]